MKIVLEFEDDPEFPMDALETAQQIRSTFFTDAVDIYVADSDGVLHLISMTEVL